MDRLLRESGVDFEKVNYYLEPLGKAKLTELIRKLGMKPRELLRTSEPIYRELGLGKKEFSDDEIISLMVKHPDLIQRPWLLILLADGEATVNEVAARFLGVLLKT
jgi:arsenate reductase